MARARRLNNEEPNTGRVNARQGTEVREEVGDDELDATSLAEQSVARILPRENLRQCALCLRQDIPVEKFREHLIKGHKVEKAGTPEGYYACWSGKEFWYPAKRNDGPCKWLCSVCGREKYYFGTGNKHGGPSTRLLDRRYALAHCIGSRYGDKAGHKKAYGKIDGQAGPVVFMHEGAPNPEQPEQTDKQVLELINAKVSKGKAKPKKSGKRDSGPNRAVRKS